MRKYWIVIFALIVFQSFFSMAENGPKPPINISFTLVKPGFATLVIYDQKGKRVRNLISNTWYNAGKNAVSWDGLDDLGRDSDAAKHGQYHVAGKPVSPGKYTIRGIVHDSIVPNYEFSVYNTGTPSWTTDDHKGGWLANHSPPQAVTFVPAEQSSTGEATLYMGSYVTEGPDGFIWTNLEGEKLGGQKWFGGVWTAAPFIARDDGSNRLTNIDVFIASTWDTGKLSGKGELRISTFPSKTNKSFLTIPLGNFLVNETKSSIIGGLASFDGVLAVSLTTRDQVLVVNARTKTILDTLIVPSPKGLTYTKKGQLLIISDKKIIRINQLVRNGTDSLASILVQKDLDAPVDITLDLNERIYVTDRGTSHQVKVFSSTGDFIKTIGRPGSPKAGPYDAQRLNNPSGLAIDSNQHLWVTENDYLPKRVSVWSLEGQLIKAFYGPSKYGGGGTVDPMDKTKFYYSEETKGTMEFKLDWVTGKSSLVSVLYRRTTESVDLGFRGAAPETPLYHNGKRYFTNCYNTNPTNGHNVVFLFNEQGGVLYPCAAIGKAKSWELLEKQKIKSKFENSIATKDRKTETYFIWSDADGNHKVDSTEVIIREGLISGITVMSDLSFCAAQLNGNSVQFSPQYFTNKSIPFYDPDSVKILIPNVLSPGSSGGSQVLTNSNGASIVTLGSGSFERLSISGIGKDGNAWSYPDLWPGLHASHHAPLPDFPGELIGTTRLLGAFFSAGQSSEKLWAVNSNHGMVYIFTSDGLFVTTLFQPMRLGQRWNMPVAKRGMDLSSLTLGEENFWTTITGTNDGNVYLIDGARSSIVKINGLQSIERLPNITVDVSIDDLKKLRQLQINSEYTRQKTTEKDTILVKYLSNMTKIDGSVGDWKHATWVNIDTELPKTKLNAKLKVYAAKGAISVSDNRLFVAYQTGDKFLLQNSGETPLAPFKTGGALDLMLRCESSLKSDGKDVSQKDIRLLVTKIKKKTYALLYRPIVKGTDESSKVPFASPSRTIYIDKIEDVSNRVELAADAEGTYEFSIPLDVLQLTPKGNMVIKGDIGILRGDGFQTSSRTYWRNKSTALVSDIPSEAELMPGLWGYLKFDIP